jgi:hypothetical protein
MHQFCLTFPYGNYVDFYRLIEGTVEKAVLRLLYNLSYDLSVIVVWKKKVM